MHSKLRAILENAPIKLIAVLLFAILVPSVLVTALGLVAVFQADTFVRDLAPMLAELQQAGFTTLAALAQELNRREILTRRDKLVGHWTPAQVDRVLERAKLKRVKVLRRSRDSDRATDAQRTTTEGHS